MASKKTTIEKVEAELSDIIIDAFNDLQITTSKRIIANWINYLSSQIIPVIKQYKEQFMMSDWEYAADKFLYTHCITSTIISLYKVIFYLKEEKNFDSWVALIDAEDFLKVCSSFTRKYPTPNKDDVQLLNELFSTCRKFSEHVFPRQGLYNSPGIIETIGSCSVCSSPFLLCEHIEGDIYNGKYCRRIDREVKEINHAALVKHPRDRRCIFRTRHDKEGYMIDVFSRERVEGQVAPNKDSYEAMLLSTKGIDLG